VQWLALAHAVAALAGNTHGVTESGPHLFGRNPIIERGLGSVVAQVSQDQLPHQRTPLGVTELVEDSEEKLASCH
jgi:hypothetical protein